MYPSQLTDNLPDNGFNTISAQSLDDKQFLNSVAKLLHSSGDVKKATRILENLSQSKESIEQLNHEPVYGC